ncbi:Glutamine synthetase [Thalictrum thalictroides]|uniref:Glutamine synthetase n=1 Tax=Thalictrum thalictroides TaxID=46969 RepID=A0A7J6VNC8_THATH|nr:Glutamine synthetase [Thalictrum thalictroides]
MRNDGGYEVIKKAIKKLGLRHKEHIAAYGEGNERRLTGHHETADINSFKWIKCLSHLVCTFSFSVTFYFRPEYADFLNNFHRELLNDASQDFCM